MNFTTPGSAVKVPIMWPKCVIIFSSGGKVLGRMCGPKVLGRMCGPKRRPWNQRDVTKDNSVTVQLMLCTSAPDNLFCQI